jgi:hypothetical protein
MAPGYEGRGYENEAPAMGQAWTPVLGALQAGFSRACR